MSVSTHVLDAVTGTPAAGIPVRLEQRSADGWQPCAERSTDGDGRVADLAGPAPPGVYRLTFDIDAYQSRAGFYPEVVVVFRIVDAAGHHHVPLLLSPYAYSTYRGS